MEPPSPLTDPGSVKPFVLRGVLGGHPGGVGSQLPLAGWPLAWRKHLQVPGLSLDANPIKGHVPPGPAGKPNLVADGVQGGW